MSKRVVITGLGTLNPLGNSLDDTWSAILEGKSGIGRVTRFDASPYTSKIIGEVKDFNFLDYGINDKSLVSKLSRMDKGIEFALVATKEALEMSGLDISSNPEETGIAVGCGVGGLDKGYESSILLYEKGNRRISPFLIPAVIDNTVAGLVSMYSGAMGPNISIQTACATANHNIATGFSYIKNGYASSMICGGMNTYAHELSFGGFCQMRALSTKYNDTPEIASRPFDKDRDGFVFAEGAGMMILEEYESAKKRGANIICELVSVGMSGDAHDIVAPHPEGKGIAHAMSMALKTGDIPVDKMGYVNLHGTSTPLGDEIEANMVHKIFSKDNDHYLAGSTKSLHGHLLGGAGGIEGIIAIKALIDGVVPANHNLFNKDEVIELDRFNTENIEKNMEYTMSNSFGFGGHNAILCFGKV